MGPSWCFLLDLYVVVPLCFWVQALEKNHNWLVYDQQREAYVQGVLAKTKELETQLNEANQALQQQHKEASSDGKLFF